MGRLAANPWAATADEEVTELVPMEVQAERAELAVSVKTKMPPLAMMAATAIIGVEMAIRILATKSGWARAAAGVEAVVAATPPAVTMEAAAAAGVALAAEAEAALCSMLNTRSVLILDQST